MMVSSLLLAAPGHCMGLASWPSAAQVTVHATYIATATLVRGILLTHCGRQLSGNASWKLPSLLPRRVRRGVERTGAARCTMDRFFVLCEPYELSVGRAIG